MSGAKFFTLLKDAFDFIQRVPKIRLRRIKAFLSRYGFVSRDESLHRQNAKLMRLVAFLAMDKTQAWSHRFLEVYIRIAIQRFRRREINSLGAVIIDLGKMNLVNKIAGHDGGDEYLDEFSKRMIRLMRTAKKRRTNDFLFRWGGDEFVVVLEDVGEEELLIWEKRITRAINKDRVMVISERTGNPVLLPYELHISHRIIRNLPDFVALGHDLTRAKRLYGIESTEIEEIFEKESHLSVDALRIA